MIPVNRPLVRKNKNKFLEYALKTKWISGDGPIVKKFEDDFAKKIGRNYCVSVTNGTSALEIAIASLNLKSGDQVIVPNLTIVSCLNAILKNGLKPIFVDVNLDDYNVSIQDLKKKLSKKTKALIMVHTYGLASNIKEILRLKKKI